MIVSEFIEWLKTQDQGATVYVLAVHEGWAYQCDDVAAEQFTVEDHYEYRDMRKNPLAKGKPYEGSRTLMLGKN